MNEELALGTRQAMYILYVTMRRLHVTIVVGEE